MPRIFQLDALINTSVLPSNIMSLRDKDFINFVKEEAGDAAAALFEIQGINSVKSLLMTENVFSIINMKSKSLDGLKTKCGLILDDNTCVVQSGVKGNIDYLIDLLKRKCVDDAKLFKLSQHNQTSSSNKPIGTSSLASQLTLTTASNTSSSQLTLTTASNTSSSQLTLTTASNALSQVISSKSSKLSINGHKKYIINTLNNWCHKNKSEFNLSNFSLVEGKHYFITIEDDCNGVLEGYIKCSCNKWIALHMRRERFQISNFYRHVLGFRSGVLCRTMEEIINNPQSTPSAALNSQQQPVSPEENRSQQTPLPALDSQQQPVSREENPSQQTPLPALDSQQQSVSPEENPSQQTPSAASDSRQHLFTPIPIFYNEPQLVLSTEDVSKQGSSTANKKQVKRKIHIVKSSYNIRESSKRMRR